MTETLRCRGWQQEAALRMLENNLHPDVAEKPEELVVYGGIGKAARNPAALAAIKRELTTLGDEETLLVQSGKPVAVFETHPAAPRVLIANSNLVGRWATWEHFRELDAAGLMMYGQMTAGSWIYIGTQGILQGTYETFAAIARQRFGGSLRGRLVVTAGLGGMGGAQPLAVTMNEGCALCIEVDLQRIERRIRERYLDERAGSLDDALARLAAAQREGRALSIGLLGNAAEILPELVARGAAVDVVTDQTSAHDPLNGYVPAGLTPEQADVLRASDPDDYLARVGQSVLAHVDAIRTLGQAGRRGVRLRQRAARRRAGPRRRGRVRLPRLRARLHPPAVLRGQGPVPLGRAVGRPGRHRRDRPRDPRPVRRPGPHPALDRAGRRARRVPGPAGADLLARVRRAPPRGAALQRDGRLGRAEGADRDRPRPPRRRLGRLAPARDRGDARRLGRGRGLADPQRARQHRDRRLAGCRSTTAAASAWACRCTPARSRVADGTELAGERIRRTLIADPGMGIVRHVDAGYDEAIEAADRLGVRIPMRAKR